MPIVVKAIILGKQAVGKSSIILKFIQGIFGNNHPTVGVDFKSFEFEHKTHEYILQIWDTAGQEKYRSIANNYYKNSHIVFVVVQASDGPQLNILEVTTALKNYQEHGSAQLIYIFVNKTDLVDSEELRSQWDKHKPLLEKFKEEYKVKQIYYVSAKETPRQDFEKCIRAACLAFVEYNNEQTLPSAIGTTLSLSPKKKAFSKGPSVEKRVNKKCC